MFQQLAAAGFWPQNFELTSMIQVLVGGLLGLAVGIERSRRQKEAGKATHFVVGAASTLLTCISLWFKENGNYGDGGKSDNNVDSDNNGTHKKDRVDADNADE